MRQHTRLAMNDFAAVWCLRQESSDFVFEPLLGAFYSSETYTLDETAWTVDLSAVDWCQRGTGGD